MTGEKSLARLLAYPLSNWLIVIILLLGTCMFVWRLGDASLRDWDEAIYAQETKEMVHSGNWLVTHRDHKVYIDKPLLYHWTTAILYKCFEINEFWSRIPSAVSAILLLVLVYLIAKLLYNNLVGTVSVLVLLTGFQFVRFARSCMLDMMLTLFIFLAVYAYLRLKQSNQKWWYILWGSFAFAFMVKYAAAMVVPMVITLALLLDRKLLTAACSQHFWLGLLIALLIIVPWHLFMYAQYRQDFFETYVGRNVIARALSPLEENTGDALFYVRILRNQFFPWVYLTPFAFLVGVRQSLTHQSRSRILVLVIVVVLGLYTGVQTKLPWYILPVYPAMAIFIACLIVHAARNPDLMAFGGLLLGVCLAVIFSSLKVIVLCSAVTIIAILILLLTKQRLYRPLALLAFLYLLMIGLNTVRPLYFQGKTPVAQLARIARSTSLEDRQPLIVYSGIYGPTALFYSDRPIKEAKTQKDIAMLCGTRQTMKIILAKDDIRPLVDNYEINVLGESGSLVYALIRQKSQ